MKLSKNENNMGACNISRSHRESPFFMKIIRDFHDSVLGMLRYIEKSRSFKHDIPNISSEMSGFFVEEMSTNAYGAEANNWNRCDSRMPGSNKPKLLTQPLWLIINVFPKFRSKIYNCFSCAPFLISSDMFIRALVCVMRKKKQI